MASCDDVRGLLGALFDGELAEETARHLHDHLNDCPECAEIVATMEMISGTIAPFAGLQPPPHMEEEIASTACRRWLGLLHSAVDRDIDQHNLDRLLEHLESCPACRRAWNDLTLIHQVGQVMVPPPHLLGQCVTVHRRATMPQLLSRRAAVAAAYVLAVLASLMIGNPVSIARSPVVQKVTETVTSEVSQVAEDGRGELQVMVYRAWRWGTQKISIVRDWLSPDDDTDQDNQSKRDQGDDK